MRRIFENKFWVLVLSVFALLSLFLLAAEMKDAGFRPGLELAGRDTQSTPLPIGQVINGIASVPLWKKITFFATAFVLVGLASLLLSPEWRKKLLFQFLRTMAIATVIYLLLKSRPELLSRLTFNVPTLSDASGVGDAADLPVPEFQPPQISNGTAYLIAFGIILLLLIVFWLAARWYMKQVSSAGSAQTLKEIATAARESLNQLSAGENSKDAIVQCYVRMSHVVEKKRGLSRERGMTAAEFAERLERAGLPRDPVNRLTRLFEAVRYGADGLSQKDISEAADCLQAILQSCGEAA